VQLETSQFNRVMRGYQSAETTACGADGCISGGIGDAAIAAASANISAACDEVMK
jgi:hypothetical protein